MGVAAVAAGMAMVGEVRRSALAWLLVASGGLLLAGGVPTNRPLTTPGFSTYVHLGAIVVTAAVLPVGSVAAARSSTWRRPRPAAAAATVLAVAALPMAVYVATVAVSWVIATHGWEPLPLGMVQRLLAADESLITVALGLHTVLTATAAASRRTRHRRLRTTAVPAAGTIPSAVELAARPGSLPIDEQNSNATKSASSAGCRRDRRRRTPRR